MTLQETEEGRMSMWEKVMAHALGIGKDVNEAIEWAHKAVDAFEARFHKESQ